MIQKTFSKKGDTCRVTFRIPIELVDGDNGQVESVAVLGDFNSWSPEAHPLTRRKNGTFSTTVSLDAGQSYRFRYLVDGERWTNDDEADSFLPNRFGGQDAVLEL